jgi:hypothetical protein
MKEHTLEVLKCLDKIHSAQTTPQERELAAGFLESHITALQLSYGKYQEFLSWMNRPEHREESTPQPDREAWDADYEGIVHEDDAQEDGA